MQQAVGGRGGGGRRRAGGGGPEIFTLPEAFGVPGEAGDAACASGEHYVVAPVASLLNRRAGDEEFGGELPAKPAARGGGSRQEEDGRPGAECEGVDVAVGEVD
jgi:hypothetical protein